MDGKDLPARWDTMLRFALSNLCGTWRLIDVVLVFSSGQDMVAGQLYLFVFVEDILLCEAWATGPTGALKPSYACHE